MIKSSLPFRLLILLLKSSIIDRYIIATRKGGMEPLIVINKIDLLEDQEDYDPILLEVERELYEEAVRAYAAAGIPLISVSAVQWNRN